MAQAAPVIRSVQILGSGRAPELETKAGQVLDPLRITRDVRRLWATRWFEDVRVESTQTPEHADLVFRLAPRRLQFLHEVKFDPPGEKKPLGLETGTPIDAERAQRVAGGFRQHLVEEGYREATVRAELIPAGAQRVDLLMHVEPGKRYRIAETHFTGEIALDANLLQRTLRTTKFQRTIQFWLRSPAYSDRAVENDLARLQSLYLAHGYFDAQLSLKNVEYADTKVTVTYDVQPGTHYQVAQPVPELCSCLLAARRKAEATGKLDFDVTVTAHESLAKKQATLTTNIETGPTYTIGRIDFRGNHSFRDATLRRAMLLDEGAVFDRERLFRSLARLSRMGLFEPLTAASVELIRHPAAQRVDITISVKERRSGRWAISGPVGPPSLAGPLVGMIAERLPPWGSGLLEASTYYATLSMSAFAHPLISVLPLAAPNPYTPLFALQRPLLPGQEWISGFSISPQLGVQGMLLSYGMGRIQQAARALLRTDRPTMAPLTAPFSVSGSSVPAGFVNCEPPQSRWRWLQVGGMIAVNWLTAPPL